MASKAPVIWSVYLLRCEGGWHYLGIAHDVDKRVAQHCSGKGSRFTRGHRVECLIGVREVGTRAEAMRLERRLKQRSLVNKLAFFGVAPSPDDAVHVRRRSFKGIPDASTIVSMTLTNNPNEDASHADPGRHS